MKQNQKLELFKITHRQRAGGAAGELYCFTGKLDVYKDSTSTGGLTK